MGSDTPIATPAASVACASDEWLPACVHGLPNPLVFANYAEHAKPAWRRELLASYARDEAHHPPVTLIRYPPGTILDPVYRAALHAAGRFVSEQIVTDGFDVAEAAMRIARLGAAAVTIAGDCLLLAREGETVWGHFVFELLAKAALAERRMPGRFRYVIGDLGPRTGPERAYADGVHEALAACGIAPSRLIATEPGTLYRFERLHDVIGLRTRDAGTHPGALAELRAIPASSADYPSVPRIAVRRRRGRPRAVRTMDGLQPFLDAQGFLTLDLESTPFPAQVTLFARADHVIASLGSDCTGLVWSRPDTRVLTLAPAGWPDAYFAPLFKQCRSIVADVRGPSASADIVHAPHDVELAAVARAFEKLRAAEPTATRRVNVDVDGEIYPTARGALRGDLDFAAGGNAHAYLGEGWAVPEPGHTWSLGPTCTVRIPPDWPPRDLMLELQGLGCVAPPTHAARPLAVCAGAETLARFETVGDNRLFFVLPAHARDARQLTFHHPICLSPRALGIGDDDRPLGFGFRTLRAWEV